MPQLDPTSFPSQIFWLIVTFALLFVFVWRFAIPRVGGMVEARKEQVALDLSASDEYRQKADAIRGEYEKLISEARGAGMALINDSIRQSEQQMFDTYKELAKRTEAEIYAEEKRIQRTKKQAIENLAPAVEEITAVIVTKLTKYNANKADVEQVVANLKSAA